MLCQGIYIVAVCFLPVDSLIVFIKGVMSNSSACRGGSSMSDSPLTITEIDERIAALRENLRELIEQAAVYSGAANEDLASQRIAEQEEELKLLTKRRDELLRPKS
jgi:hypothetical protein